MFHGSPWSSKLTSITSAITLTTELPEKFERKKKMQCYNCETELTWGGDHDIEEEFDHVDAHKMVTNLTCPNCATFHLVYTPKSFFEQEKETK